MFTLSGVLPEGMSFPYDFGFLPGTLGDDGDAAGRADPDGPRRRSAAASCPVGSSARSWPTRPSDDGKVERNDRLVAVPVNCRVYNDCTSLKDLNDHRLEEIQQFFVSYNRIHGKKFEVRTVHGPHKAEELARAGMAGYKKKRRARPARRPRAAGRQRHSEVGRPTGRQRAHAAVHHAPRPPGRRVSVARLRRTLLSRPEVISPQLGARHPRCKGGCSRRSRRRRRDLRRFR